MSAEQPTSPKAGVWSTVARLVTEHPVRVFAASLAVVLLPALAVPSIELSYDTIEELPAGAESVRSYEVLADHFPAGELSPVMLLVDDDEPVTEPASLRALGDLSRNLRRLEGVAAVRSVAMPTNGERPEAQASDEQLQQFQQFDDQLSRAADGAGQVRDGIARIEDGLARIDQRLPELRSGLEDATSGAGQLLDGVGRARDGVGRLQDGVDRLRDGVGELRTGLVDARDGTRRLQDDVAVPAEQSIRAAWQTLFDEFTIGRADPAYQDAVEEVGQTYGRITGEDPRTGEQVDPDYDGLPESLDELASGLAEAVEGADQLDDGLARLDDGLAELQGGFAELEDGIVALRDGLAEAQPGVDELADGVDRMLDGAGRLERRRHRAARTSTGRGRGTGRGGRPGQARPRPGR